MLLLQALPMVTRVHALDTAPLALTTARQVHDLPAAKAARQIPVHLVATVSLYEPLSKLLFVQDASGAVFIYTSKPYAIANGDLIEINGTTERSFRTDIRTDPQIRVLRHGSLPAPVLLDRQSYTRLMNGRWDCLRVTLRGKVRSATLNNKEFGRLDMELLVDGGSVNVTINHPNGIPVEDLIDSDILVTGVIGADFDARWREMTPHLIGASDHDIRVVHRSRRSFADAPEIAVSNIMATQSVTDTSRRVRVRGVVTAYRPGTSIVIRQGQESLSATTQQRIPLALGAVVELSGFATPGHYGPGMKQATIIPTGQSQQVQPYRASFAEAVRGIYSDEYISVRGKVLSQMHSESLDQVTMLVDGHAIDVNLERTRNDRQLPTLPLGTEIEVRGICRVTITDGWGNVGATSMIFRLDMRSAQDITVLRTASWWTIEHLFELLFALCLASLVICLWALGLRRRISSQTMEIKRSMMLERERSRLLESINSMTPIADWVEELRRTCEMLLPGVRCLCNAVDAEPGAVVTPKEASDAHACFECKLHDGKDTVLGTLLGYREDGRALCSYEHEVLEVLASLAAIAVNHFRMYQELNYSSTHDQLTALPNRRMADTCLERALVQNSRKEPIVAVAYIDVDRFKQVNDQHGHRIGDLYLQQIAQRLKGAVRTTDMIARVGGDEFLMVAGDLRTVPQAEMYRERLNACFEKPFVLDGLTISGAASVGLAIAPDHGNSAEELKRHADLDMYTVKNWHRAPAPPPPAGLYSPSDLETALTENRFELFYQPLFCAEGNLRGMEALIRMNDPMMGLVPPASFIDVAEESSVIVPLGRWVLKQALSDAKRWDLQALGARVMVNVSMRQVEQPDFAADVLSIVRSAGVSPQCLELEITERLMMENPPQVMRQLTRLRENGVRIAIDDFGVQHSSLSALRSLPFDTLKLDRTFVTAIEEDERALHIVGAIVSMAQALGKRVVAEGIESEEQVRTLSGFPGIDLQGYYFSRPRPAHELTVSMNAWSAGNNTKAAKAAASELSQLALAS